MRTCKSFFDGLHNGLNRFTTHDAIVVLIIYTRIVKLLFVFL